MAIARKVIVLDFITLSPAYVWAIAGVTAAMSLGYWLVNQMPNQGCVEPEGDAERLVD